MFHPLYPSSNQGRHSPGDNKIIKKEKIELDDSRSPYKQFLTVGPLHHYQKPTSLPLDKPRLGKLARRSSPDLRYASSDVLQQLHASICTDKSDKRLSNKYVHLLTNCIFSSEQDLIKLMFPIDTRGFTIIQVLQVNNLLSV